MYLTVVILPLLGSIVSGFFGRKVGSRGSQIITSFFVILTTMFALVLFFEVGFNSIPVTVNLSRWLDSEFFNIFWDFRFDALTVYFVCISNKWYKNAVWVKIPLYMVIFVNKFCSDGGFLFNNSGMAYLNTKSFLIFIERSFIKDRKDKPSVRIAYLSCLQKRYFSIKSTASSYTQSLSEKKGSSCSFWDEENFLQWFVGLSDAESNFFINTILKKDKVTISSFSFMFKIELHKDDEGVLKYIHSKLAIGNVRLYKNVCIFNITDREGIKLIISIFDKYNLNTTKHLDYLDFKEAFNLYINKYKNLSADSVKKTILGFKNKMNTNRVNFDRPENSKIVITKSWLLGFIEGDGSFFVRRDTLIPVFYIELRVVQLNVLLKIKEFLEKYLDFNSYSLYKLKNSSIITITTIKARKNSKSSVALTIKNVKVLNNYLIPFLDDMTFLTKKGQDFQDFKIISRVIQNGAYRKNEIKKIILKLSYTMNNYRLSTHTAPAPSLSKDERDSLFHAAPTIEHLYDGRVRDIFTGKVIHQQTSCVYEIRKLNGEVLMANTLSEAASIIGVYPDTLSKYLDVEVQDSVEYWVELNNFKIRRVPVFNQNPFA